MEVLTEERHWKMLKNVFKDSSKTFAMRIFQGIIFSHASDHLSNYHFHNLTLTTSSKLSLLASSSSSEPIIPLPFSISSALTSASSPLFRLPPPFLPGARFGVLAIAVAASFYVYVSGKQSKRKCNSKSLIKWWFSLTSTALVERT